MQKLLWINNKLQNFYHKCSNEELWSELEPFKHPYKFSTADNLH